jgi:hypothetical protein
MLKQNDGMLAGIGSYFICTDAISAESASQPWKVGRHSAFQTSGYHWFFILKDLINALPGNSSVNTVQHAAIEKVVFSINPIEAPID